MKRKKLLISLFIHFIGKWEILFSKDAENVYSEMIEQVNKGQRLTIEDVDLYSLDEVGFKNLILL